MIFDPDEPLPGSRTERQSLICTEVGWATLGQPTQAAELQFKKMRAELGDLCSDVSDLGVSRTASLMVTALHGMGVV